MKTIKFVLPVYFLLLPHVFGFAQETIDKEIIVVKPYQPVLSDAHKINLLPEINDTSTIKPTFIYQISPRHYETEYVIKRIKAATLVAEPLEKIYKSYFELGIGNYLTPNVELNINSLRSRDKWYGIYLKHNSINGKIKLDNGDKVNPGFNQNMALLEAKKIFKKSVLSGFVSPEYHGLNFYGYDPMLDDTLKPVKDSIKQHYVYAGAGIRMESAYKDSSHLNYNIGFNWGYSGDHFGFSEHAFRFSSDMNKSIRNFVVGMKAGISYYYTPGTFDSVNNTVISADAWFSKSSPEFAYKLGASLSVDAAGDDIHVYPHLIAFLQIKVLDKIMIPYFGLEGNLQENYFGKISRENMYMMPGLSVKNTNHKVNGYIGLKGNYYSRLSYNLNFNYTITDNMYFYINDTSGNLGNQFGVEYDDIERINVLGEVIFRPVDKLSFTLKANWFKYNLDTLEYAWHMPQTDLSLSAGYNLKNKILVHGSLAYVGARYAKARTGEAVKLDGYADLSLGLEYRYSKILSAFIRLNNILGMNQEPWMFYPSMRFNALIGFTYSL